MRAKKKFSLRLLSLLLTLLLLIAAVPFAGIISVSADNTGLDVYLVGGMTGWGSLEEYKFVEEGNGIYSYVWDMTGGVYECKIFTGNWGTSIGANDNDDNNIIFDVETDTIMKITANVNTRSYTAVEMDAKADFTLGSSANTIEAEKYTYALGEVAVLTDSKASAGKYVGDFNEGDVLNYGVTVSGTEPVTYRFEINVASEADAGELAFTVRSTNSDGVFEKIIGKDVFYSNFITTGSWQTYKTIVITATLNPGYNRISLENIGGTYNVDKMVVTPVKDYADVITKGETTLDFKGFDGASDSALVKDGKISGLEKTELVSIIVKPEQDGVYTISFDEKATKSGNLCVETDDSLAAFLISEEDPTADIVIECETEIYIYTVKDAIDVESISFKYTDNVDLMGYHFYEENYAGIRFANTFAVSEIAINSYGDIEGGKLHFSDGTYVNVDAIAQGGEKVIKLSEPKAVTWIKFEAQYEEVSFKVKGEKDGSSDTDIAFQGYVSTSYGWLPVSDVAYTDIKATEGKVGFGFDGEVTVDKVVFVGAAGNEGTPVPTNPTDPSGSTATTDPTSTTVIEPTGSTPGTTSADKTYLLGDADENGKVNVKDATVIQKHAAKLLMLVGDAVICADVNFDEKINVKDATAIQKFVAKIPVEYPIGEEITVDEDAKADADVVSVAAIAPVAVDAGETVKATLTTADNNKVELTGTVVGNDIVFELEDVYSFGFYFDFGKELEVNAIQIYGDPTYNGGSVNVSSAQDYNLFVNGLTENDSRVIANTGNYILTSETGTDREWEFNLDTSDYGYDYPSFYAPNTPLAEAAYNLTMKEVYNSIRDTADGDVFYTGTGWAKVWTRDTAMSMQYILSWLFPEISTNCAYAKVVGKDGNLTFEEDTGTGGSYPVSTDRIIMMLAVWETYLANGNKEDLEYFYNVASNTIMQDYEVVYDKEAGLFRGETCGLDHRDKTYNDWTGENDENGIVTIAEGKAANTNILFCQAMKILSESALILGKGEAESKAWADLAADLEEAISERLWHEDLGTYTSWEYPDWMGSPLAYKQDVLANGYAVWYNIGGQEKADSIMENHTLVPFGANTVYPNKNAERWTDYKYHDSGIWPGWEAILMIGAVNNENENNLLAEEIWNSCIRGAVSCLTNYEVIDYETGRGLHSTNQLWSVAATMAGYYRVLYGMEYTTDGITFDPYVPDWMEGPFYVENYKYRDATLSLTLNGKGDTVESIYVNGEKVEDAANYVFPVDAKGDYNITINVKDSGAEDKVNLKAENTTKAPTAPNATLSGTTLRWNAVKNCTYKVWTGSEYKDVTGTTYTIDDTAYGVYSVVAVDNTTGLWSELSKPITYSPAGSNVTVNVGNVQNTSTFTVNIPVDGEYQLSAIHTNQGDPTAGITAAIRSVYVDGEDVGTLVFPAMSFGHQISSHLRLALTAGKHEVTVKYANENWYDRNMSNAHGENNNNVTFHMFQFTLVDGAFSDIEPPAKKTVYFSNNKNWSKVNIFYWGGSDSTTWPGTAMTYVGKNNNGEDVYKFELDPSTPNIIFNNGSQQTVDIITGVEDGKGFYLLDTTNDKGYYNVGTYNYGD